MLSNLVDLCYILLCTSIIVHVTVCSVSFSIMIINNNAFNF